MSTLVVASWCAILFVLDDIFDLWILIVPLVCPPVIGLVIYLMVEMAASLAKHDDQRLLAVLLGPVAAVTLVFVVTSISGGLGFTSDYVLFLAHRSELLTKAAKLPADRAVVVKILRMSGFFTGCTSATVVVRDPGHEIDAPSAQRDDGWRRQVPYIVQDVRCGSSPPAVSVRHLEGDFYAVKLD